MKALEKDARRRYAADGVVGVTVQTVIAHTSITYNHCKKPLEFDGTRFLPGVDGTIVVPAVDLEFIARGAAVKRIAGATLKELQACLNAV